MNLSELEIDALAEVFNHGVGAAANSLSQIAGEPVKLSVPRVRLATRQALATQMEEQGCERLCAVRQRFAGIMDTDTVLMFPVDQSLLLVQMMVGSDTPLDQLGEMEQDAMAEIGNILLNAVVGSMANILHMDFDGALPTVQQGTPSKVLMALESADESVLNMDVDFEISQREIRGYLAFLLNMKSVHVLQGQLAKFLAGELP